ncbi:hypothetical protein [Hymenobacter fodinae]|uniref:Lipoprotein n=1 Tax=Hymenobacter fodinae TaxID=2510796 RepID=A0A4Z0P275_9BACT|nr:hypothetical protein [Hymenobacter fodinae]TGE04902.1 hypothetical protein EU556_22275 [Hymenobacter fodinae]
MRELITSLLVTGSIALLGCSAHPSASLSAGKELVGTQDAVQWQLISADSDQAKMLGPDPTVAYQEVQLSDVVATNSAYTATIRCNQDSLGTLRLQVQLDHQRLTIKKLQLLYAGNSRKYKVNQIGDGVGHYDATDQRYYFTVAYQTISELPQNMRYGSGLYQINGWISTETTTAGLQPISLAD